MRRLVRDLKIRAKLVLLVSLAALAFAAQVLVGLSTLQRLRVGGPVHAEIARGQAAALATARAETALAGYAFARSRGDREAARAAADRVDAALAAALEAAPPGDGRSNLGEARDRFHQQRDAAFNPAALARLQNLVGEAGAHLEAIATARTEEADHDARSQMQLLVAAATVVFIALGFVAIAVVRAVAAPLRRVTATAIALASGRVPARSSAAGGADELGQLSRVFDGLIGLLRDLLARGQAAARRLDGAAKELVAANVQMSEGVRAQAARLSDASGETSRMASALGELSTAFDAVSRTVSENAEAAEAGSRAVGSSGEALEGIRQAGQDVQEAIAATILGAERIRKIVDVLEEIAGETHVLSLNASIEAARAGDRGKGFGVVATEVRGLAERAAKSAHEIRAIVADTARHLRGAQDAVQRNTAAVERGVGEGRALEGVFASIHAAAQETNGAVGEMSAVLADQVEATRRTASLVGEVSRLAEERRAAGEAILAQGTRLHEVVADLDALLGRFQLEAEPASAPVEPGGAAPAGAPDGTPAAA